MWNPSCCIIKSPYSLTRTVCIILELVHTHYSISALSFHLLCIPWLVRSQTGPRERMLLWMAKWRHGSVANCRDQYWLLETRQQKPTGKTWKDRRCGQVHIQYLERYVKGGPHPSLLTRMLLVWRRDWTPIPIVYLGQTKTLGHVPIIVKVQAFFFAWCMYAESPLD